MKKKTKKTYTFIISPSSVKQDGLDEKSNKVKRKTSDGFDARQNDYGKKQGNKVNPVIAWTLIAFEIVVILIVFYIVSSKYGM